jgi:hypothetical protein
MKRRGAKRVGKRGAAKQASGGAGASRRAREPGGVAGRLPGATAEDAAAAKRKYEEGVVSRGEAAPAGEPLGPGMTHEITGHAPDGRPLLKRKRFSLR